MYINDMLEGNGNIMSSEEIKNEYKFNGTVLDYLALVQSIPVEWKRKQRTGKGINPIIHPNIQNIISHKLGNKYIYNILINKKYGNIYNWWLIYDGLYIYHINKKYGNVKILRSQGGNRK